MVIAIDPGHGGRDPGAVYDGRQEKDDNLRLALAVGNVLENSGIDVFYTRDNDIYETPGKKAADANSAGADYFISFHRNSSEYPDQYTGAEVLVYDDSGERARLARNVLEGMEAAGYKNLGVDERKDLTVLRRTQMPAILIEAGFINTDADNEVFDDNFDLLANQISNGILKTFGMRAQNDTMDANDTMDGNDTMDANGTMARNDSMSDDGMDYGNVTIDRRYSDRNDVVSSPLVEEPSGKRCECNYVLYRVQVGAFRNRESAERILNSLIAEEFPAYIVFDGELYKVQVGAYRNLSNAIAMENRLRQYRYNTYITTK